MVTTLAPTFSGTNGGEMALMIGFTVGVFAFLCFVNMKRKSKNKEQKLKEVQEAVQLDESERVEAGIEVLDTKRDDEDVDHNYKVLGVGGIGIYSEPRTGTRAIGNCKQSEIIKCTEYHFELINNENIKWGFVKQQDGWVKIDTDLMTFLPKEGTKFAGRDSGRMSANDIDPGTLPLALQKWNSDEKVEPQRAEAGRKVPKRDISENQIQMETLNNDDKQSRFVNAPESPVIAEVSLSASKGFFGEHTL